MHYCVVLVNFHLSCKNNWNLQNIRYKAILYDYSVFILQPSCNICAKLLIKIWQVKRKCPKTPAAKEVFYFSFMLIQDSTLVWPMIETWILGMKKLDRF